MRMSFRPLLASLCTAALLSLASLPAESAVQTKRELSASDMMHAQSALYFADRQNWRDAVLHARKANNKILPDYVLWRQLRYGESGFDFADYSDFLARNKGWPDEKKLILHAENQLFSDEDGLIPLAEKIRWFKSRKPISGRGKIAYASLVDKRQYGQEVIRMIREAWIEGDYDPSQERAIMREYGQHLRQQDHIARIDRLVWEEKTTAAARLFFAVPDGYQKLYEARIRLQLDKPGANSALARVPAHLQDDPGLFYERMKWRERKGMEEGVQEMLLQAPANTPYGEKWWKLRQSAVREAVNSHKYDLALRLLKRHGQMSGAEKAEALWLMGWIKLVYLQQAKEAYADFEKIDNEVQTPVSKSRAFYWTGRAAEARGMKEKAREYYVRASQYPTCFYGQMAIEKLKSALLLPVVPELKGKELQRVQADPRVHVVALLAQVDREKDAYSFIKSIVQDAKNPSEAMYAAELGIAMGRRDYGVKAAKEAIRRNYVLTQASYPYYQLNFKPTIEQPVIWAITRQESEFDPYAGSSVGAQGLMQLMPGTAKEVARKNGLGYSPNRLSEPLYNLYLGSYYINQMVGQFDGSYVAAIAAYNAGPGRVRQWLDANGSAGKTPEQVINWIERIPYSETRNYVQRVLENIQVYRAVLNPRSGAQIKLEEDLVR